MFLGIYRIGSTWLEYPSQTAQDNTACRPPRDLGSGYEFFLTFAFLVTRCSQQNILFQIPHSYFYGPVEHTKPPGLLQYIAFLEVLLGLGLATSSAMA